MIARDLILGFVIERLDNMKSYQEADYEEYGSDIPDALYWFYIGILTVIIVLLVIFIFNL